MKEKEYTVRQLKKLMEILQGSESDRVQEVLGSGILSDVFDPSARLNRLAVRRALGLGAILSTPGSHVVNYGMTLEHMIAASNCDRECGNIIAGQFPIVGEGDVKFSAQGDKVVVSGGDRSHLVDLKNKNAYMLDGEGASFSPDGSRVATNGDMFKPINIYTLKDGKMEKTDQISEMKQRNHMNGLGQVLLNDPENVANSVQFTDANKLVYEAAGAIKLYDLNEKKVLNSWTFGEEKQSHVGERVYLRGGSGIRADGKVYYVVSRKDRPGNGEDQKINILNLETGKVQSLEYPNSFFNSISFDANGNLVISQWDVKTDQDRTDIYDPATGSVKEGGWTPKIKILGPEEKKKAEGGVEIVRPAYAINFGGSKTTRRGNVLDLLHSTETQ
jgi:WD40 repeat protein